ncbi:DNA-binding response regulator [Streptomyces sp. Ru72]|nr:DNA-binding response regulator [Streptomyces sp. Ru72]
MIRVLLVHENRLLRSALAALLGQDSGLEVATSSWGDAVSEARSLGPQVCVVDVDTPVAPGAAHGPESAELAGLAALSDGSRGPGLLVLASPGRPGLLRRMWRARPLGFVNKDAAPDALLGAIRRVAKGERFVDSSLGHDFLRASEIPLTPRELSVLSLAAEGASVSEIARSLHLCNGTVRNYMAAITRKTGGRNRVDAIRISHGAGWL